MQTFNEILQVIGAFAVGIAGRTLLFLVGAALLTIPAVIFAVALNAVRGRKERALAHVGNLVYREGAYYAPNHTWLAPRSAGDFDVGIDDIARKIIPGSSSVELPKAGTRFHKGDPIAVVRAGGREVMISAPLDGEVWLVDAARPEEAPTLAHARRALVALHGCEAHARALAVHVPRKRSKRGRCRAQ